MKAYKIIVPEKDYCDPLGVGYESEYTRQEIHKLIKKKAIELGRKIDTSNYFDDEEYVYLYADGYTCTGEENCKGFEETSYQDFLKITPGDVADNVGKQSFIPVDCSENQDNLTQGEIPIIEQPKNITDERKELAKVILNSLLMSPIIRVSNPGDEVELAFIIADKFIKHVEK